MDQRLKTVSAQWLRSWTTEEKLRQHEDKVLLILTLIIGALVGLVVVAFILLTENLALRMYPAGGAAWRRLLIPVLGSLIGGILLKRYFPAARGSGIPQTKAALFLENGFISFKTMVGKFGCSSLSLASGIALGREGPSVQVGAGIASVLGRRLGLSPSRLKALVPIGASAALAAAFNTPIAAVLFTLEEVMGDRNAPVLGSIVLSSATSWIVLRTLLGNEPLFHVPSYQLVHPGEFLAYMVLGVIGGLMSVLFVKLLLWLRHNFLAMPEWTVSFQPAVGGLLVGVFGWFVPEVMGVGYGQVGRALNGEMGLSMLVLLVTLKLIATATCYASGNAGGIFGPSLFIGAMLGGAVGSVAHSLFPDYTGSIGAYALVGMGTAFAGIIRVPLTSAVMIFEVTRDYSIIVPLMISNLLSYIISYRLQREPIYEAIQHQEGIHLPSFVRQREGLLLTSQAMRPAGMLPRTDQTANDVPLPSDQEENAWPVVDSEGLVGMIRRDQLEQATQPGRGAALLGEILPHHDWQVPLTAENFPHVHDDHPLDVVLRRMAESGMNVLPVVNRSNLRKLEGLVSLKDVLRAYGLGDSPRQAAPLQEGQTVSSLPLLAGISASLLILLLLIGFFVYHYRVQRQAAAGMAFKKGITLAEQGRNEEAIEQYRNALSLSHSREHRLALALALEKMNQLNEAAIYLRELIKDEPNSGVVNLGWARLEARQGIPQEAVTYYHRAIYGAWPKGSAGEPAKVRFELVDFLAKIGAKKQAVTELMALAEEFRDDLSSKKRIGHRLLDFGAVPEAAEVFKGVLKQEKHDAEAYTGLGDAEFAQHNYPAAQEAYLSALRWDPGNSAVEKRKQVCHRIMAMDPTLRGLSTAECFRRSEALLEQTQQNFDSCQASRSNFSLPEELRTLSKEAQKAVRRKVLSSRYAEETETNLELAGKLWQARKNLCGSPQPEDEALTRVMDHLGP